MLIAADPPETDAQVAPRLVGCLSKLEPGAASEIATALYGTFLELLTKFIGERLVLRIMKSALPALDETGIEETE